MRLGRRAWGCDLNPQVIKWRPTISDYDPDPDIPEQQYDQDYPFYEFLEAGLTEEQLSKIVPNLLRTTSAEELAKAPGIGIQKAREFVSIIQNSERGSQSGLGDF